jgi:transglutaminase-like putative cysteine protease
MRFSIRHETIYRYSSPANYTIQLLRLTPRAESHQRVVNWTLDAPARLQPVTDAFGNLTHTLTLTVPHEEIRISAHGTVDLGTLDNGRLPAEPGGIAPLAFGVATPLTQPDEAIASFVRQALPRGLRNATDALLLASMLCDRIAYVPGVTLVSSAATQAFAQSSGVCQDHAHIFLACCRVLGTPARYVSGYVHPGTADYAASHAWVDVWFAQGGWVSVDITNRQLTSDRHCRLAVARDYESASPIRGVRTGGGKETMEVKVSFPVVLDQ